MAEINCRVIPRKDPLSKEVKYYLTKASYSMIRDEELCRRISDNTGIPRAVVKAAEQAIIDQLRNFAANGHTVKFGDLISFRLRILSWGQTAENLVSKKQLRRFKMNYVFGTQLKKYQKPEFYTFNVLPPKVAVEENPSA